MYVHANAGCQAEARQARTGSRVNHPGYLIIAAITALPHSQPTGYRRSLHSPRQLL